MHLRALCTPGLGLLLLLLSLSACGAKAGEGIDAGGGEVQSLQITPEDVELTVVNGALVQQAYTVMATYADGETIDVTDRISLSVDNAQVGSFLSDVFQTSGFAGGESIVRANLGEQSAETGIVVVLKTERVEDGAPLNAADIFDAATEDPLLAPSLVYPDDQTYLPPNLGDFEVHWTSSAQTDLYEISLTSAYSSLRLFTTQDAAAGAFAKFTPAEWSTVGESARGQDVQFQVRALNTAAPETVGASDARTAKLTDTNVEGGIYYWASSGALPGGVYRHDMGRPGQSAEAFYTTAETPSSRCVACHVLSRDGEKMAVTYDGGNGAASIVDVASKTPLLATDRTFEWNFAAFEPSGDRIVTVRQGVLTLRDVTTGDVINTVPTQGPVSHVDFSATGDKIAYAALATPAADWSFSGGSIVVQTFEPGSAMWGTPVTLYQPPAGTNAYYPSFSPDGEWVVFNQSATSSYDAATAELFVMRADGSTEPLRLDSPNVTSGLTNSWARWAPFVQELRPTGETPEQFFWLTFSSKRAFGVRLGQGTPQLWMTPFFPGRAAAETDPSGPAFRLPFQELNTNNHIAQWTTRIVPID
tara:strand:+ start:100287 stop:102050 length:1764 start_codon:yes stop_codon:yes gene_type:complete